MIVKHSPNCIIVPVANPLDAMSQAVFRLSKFPRERVIGMAGVLDSGRMRTFLAQELNVSVQDVSVFVLGGHGDEMVPLARYSTVGGVPLTEVLSADRIEAISKRTAGGGGELTKLIGTSAWVAPGTSAAGPIESLGSVAIEPLCTRFSPEPPSVPLFSLHAPITTSSASAPPVAAALFRRI